MLIMLGMLIDLVIFHFSQIMKIPTARSPSTNSYNFAWDVRSSGAMDYGHYGSRSDYSYGLYSPGTDFSVRAWCVSSSGFINNYFINDGIVSYGYQYIIRVRFTSRIKNYSICRKE